jgi:hypothetical protein
MTMRRSAIAAVLLIATTAVQAATTYRVTTTIKDRLKRIPRIERVIADGENRRLSVEQQDEPFTHDVLLSTDGGKTIVALNTPLRTWFDVAILPPSTSNLKLRKGTKIKDPKVTVSEESGNEPISGFPVRKFVIRASFTAEENYGGTKVKRENAMTAMLWTTDKIDGALAFPPRAFGTGVDAIDAELRQKTAIISGFPLRAMTTYSQAYEEGAPTVEIINAEVDDIRTVASPPATLFAKPADYINQPPIISGAPVVISH